MPIEIRALTDDELFDAHLAFARSIHVPPLTPERFEVRRSLWWRDRSFGAFDGAALVGHAGAFPFDTLLPGGAVVPTYGVTRVGVLATHRRQGALTGLMAAQLRDCLDRGEPLASLRASEGVIYRRFGYGVAGSAVRLELDARHGALAVPPADGGSIRYVHGPEVLEVVPAAYERCRRRPGALTRPAALWAYDLADVADPAKATMRSVVVHFDRRGRADGFAVYEPIARDDWDEAGHRVELRDLWGSDDEVEAALWAFMLSLDLVHVVVAEGRPIDDPLRWRLADPRSFKVTEMWDEQWLRLVDVAAVWGERSYGADSDVVIEITDDALLDHNVGRFRVGAGGCRRVRSAADLRMGIAAAGAATLGGVSFVELVAAGRAEEVRRGAASRADALFGSRPLPWCGTHF